MKLTIDGIAGNLTWKHAINDYGGMPSAHTALVTSILIIAWFTHGIQSTMFALTAVLAVVVIRDATGMRRQLGRQAKLLNQMQAKNRNKEVVELQERIGHNWFEVLVGAVVGVVLTLVLLGFTIAFTS